MHNVNTEALERTIAKAEEDPGTLKQRVSFDGEWQDQEGQPQFRATIPVPNGEPFVFEADFPPPMGGAVGSLTFRSRCCPRSSKRTPSTSPACAIVAWLRSTSLPAARLEIRAARFTAAPNQSPERSTAGPVCMPTRIAG
jgi:hypothetical protein